MAIPAYFGYDYITPLRHDVYPSIKPTSTSLSQPEKVVLITGAGKGIGRSIVLSYAKANVACLILLARTKVDLDAVGAEIATINPKIRVRTFAVDVTSEDGIASIAEQVKRLEGRLDILVNNAGYTTPWVLMTESPADDYWRTIEINVKGPILLLHAFLPLLKATGVKTGKGTDAITISSIGAHAIRPTAKSPADDYWRTIEINVKGPILLLHAFLPLLKATGVKTGKGTDAITISSIGAHAIRPTASAYQVSKFALLRLGEFVDVVSVNWDVDGLEKMRGEIEGTDKLKMRMVL
ncbi:uncharacterized protein PAC_03956 [Phialocephala subalpina]|uniref:Peroxisomal short-chain alcohol dehydrogenase n=1 Tax=Phialocephala subalpina TaxID=576137 RepID=A0A1L7WMT2_9HELO|nr:uncharacterized protein PAC_03956 [Phialocephala subalpina]